MRIQTQPSPPKNGMNEIMVEISGRHGKGVRGLVVSTRTADSDPWKQTFPDGDLGIYHGAAKLEPGRQDLQVQIEEGGEKSALTFHIRMGASG